VGAGECAFLPKGKPHAFLIQSAEIDVLALMTPGGFLNAVNKMNAPAERMKLPSDDAVTYANGDSNGNHADLREVRCPSSFSRRDSRTDARLFRLRLSPERSSLSYRVIIEH
jgi:hypothetical protein